MITKITGEAPFQVMTSNFSISPSQEGYTLQISADGKQYSNLFSVGAGVTRLVTGVAANSYYRLLGNQSQVSVNWLKSCGGEGGGSGSGTELSPVAEFPLGAEAGTVVAYNGTASASGVYQYTGEEWVPVGVDDLSAYWTSAETKSYVDSAVSVFWTSAQTESAITAVEDHLFDVEEVTASALTELHNAVLELSGSSVDLSRYYTSGETDAAISAATAGKADKANVTARDYEWFIPNWNSQGIITGDAHLLHPTLMQLNGAPDFEFISTDGNSPLFYAPTTSGNLGEVLISTGNGAPVWSAMPAADVTKAYVDSAITEVQDQIDTMDEVVSQALVDLNTRKVESTSVSTIWKGTQAEYDAATQSGATANPATLYIIVNNS